MGGPAPVRASSYQNAPKLPKNVRTQSVVRYAGVMDEFQVVLGLGEPVACKIIVSIFGKEPLCRKEGVMVVLVSEGAGTATST